MPLNKQSFSKGHIGNMFHVGDKIEVPTYIYQPKFYSSNGIELRAHLGQIVECLIGGGCAVKFDDYPHATDYTRKEAAQFIRRT